MNIDDLEILRACLKEAGFEVSSVGLIVGSSCMVDIEYLYERRVCDIPHFSDPDWIEKLKIWYETCSKHSSCSTCSKRLNE